MKNPLRVCLALVFCSILAAGLVACGGGGGGGDATTGDTGGNTVPIANAGANQNVSTGTMVTLNGTGCSDADGDLLSHSWSFVSKPSGSAAALSDPTAVNPQFTPDLDGTYIIGLIVNDGTANSAPDTVTVTASTANSAPVANAGPDQNVSTGSVVTFDGSGSSDADLDPLTYSWSFTSKPSGSAAALSDSTLVDPQFTPDLDGDYVLSLVVNDGLVDSAADSVTVTASTPNSAPVADAGPDQDVDTGFAVALDGSGSSDADLDSLTYIWAFTSKPSGSAAALSNSAAVDPTFTADLDGTYVLSLVVNDGTVDSAADTVAVNASTPVFVNTKTEIDDTHNGISGSIDEAYYYTYDASGNMTVKEWDYDNDSVVDEVYTYTYDASGNLTKEEYDGNNDGTADRVSYYTYDAGGNLTLEELDLNGNGTVDRVSYRTYDASGNMVKKEWDYNNDGTINFVYFYTYDASWKLTKEEFDNNNDGTIDWVYSHTYDADGNMTKEEFDNNNDGTIDWVYSYTYDADGNMVLEEYDNFNDGVIDSTYYYTYDADGNLTKEEDDTDNNGTIDSAYYYAYDSWGNLIQEDWDYNYDGTMDSVTYYTWTRL